MENGKPYDDLRFCGWTVAELRDIAAGDRFPIWRAGTVTDEPDDKVSLVGWGMGRPFPDPPRWSQGRCLAVATPGFCALLCVALVTMAPGWLIPLVGALGLFAAYSAVRNATRTDWK